MTALAADSDYRFTPAEKVAQRLPKHRTGSHQGKQEHARNDHPPAELSNTSRVAQRSAHQRESDATAGAEYQACEGSSAFVHRGARYDQMGRIPLPSADPGIHLAFQLAAAWVAAWVAWWAGKMAQSNTAFAWSAPTGFAESNQLMATDWTSPDLDALVAAPAHHRLLFEHDRVRVLDTRIDPGDRTPLHTHRWPASHYVLSWSDFVRRDADGGVLVDTRQGPRTAPPLVVWGEPLPPHSLENVGAAPIHIISTELKDRTDAEQARMAALSVSKQT